jgi:hypothetical protein
MTDVALHACQSPWSEPGNFDGIRRHLCWRIPDLEGSIAHDQSERNLCPPANPPAPLTIAGGVARYNNALLPPSSAWTELEGSVNAQGELVMRSPSGVRLNAQLDGRGTIEGRVSGFCGHHIVWQKEAK